MLEKIKNIAPLVVDGLFKVFLLVAICFIAYTAFQFLHDSKSWSEFAIQIIAYGSVAYFVRDYNKKTAKDNNPTLSMKYQLGLSSAMTARALAAEKRFDAGSTPAGRAMLEKTLSTPTLLRSQKQWEVLFKHWMRSRTWNE